MSRVWLAIGLTYIHQFSYFLHVTAHIEKLATGITLSTTSVSLTLFWSEVKLRHQRLEEASHGYVGKHSADCRASSTRPLITSCVHAWRRMGIILNIWCKQPVFSICLDTPLHAIASSLAVGWLLLRYCSDTRSRRVATGAWAVQLRRSCISCDVTAVAASHDSGGRAHSTSVIWLNLLSTAAAAVDWIIRLEDITPPDKHPRSQPPCCDRVGRNPP